MNSRKSHLADAQEYAEQQTSRKFKMIKPVVQGHNSTRGIQVQQFLVESNQIQGQKPGQRQQNADLRASLDRYPEQIKGSSYGSPSDQHHGSRGNNRQQMNRPSVQSYVQESESFPKSADASEKRRHARQQPSQRAQQRPYEIGDGRAGGVEEQKTSVTPAGLGSTTTIASVPNSAQKKLEAAQERISAQRSQPTFRLTTEIRSSKKNPYLAPMSRPQERQEKATTNDRHSNSRQTASRPQLSHRSTYDKHSPYEQPGFGAGSRPPLLTDRTPHQEEKKTLLQEPYDRIIHNQQPHQKSEGREDKPYPLFTSSAELLELAQVEPTSGRVNPVNIIKSSYNQLSSREMAKEPTLNRQKSHAPSLSAAGGVLEMNNYQLDSHPLHKQDEKRLKTSNTKQRQHDIDSIRFQSQKKTIRSRPTGAEPQKRKKLLPLKDIEANGSHEVKEVQTAATVEPVLAYSNNGNLQSSNESPTKRPRKNSFFDQMKQNYLSSQNKESQRAAQGAQGEDEESSPTKTQQEVMKLKKVRAAHEASQRSPPQMDRAATERSKDIALDSKELAGVMAKNAQHDKALGVSQSHRNLPRVNKQNPLTESKTQAFDFKSLNQEIRLPPSNKGLNLQKKFVSNQQSKMAPLTSRGQVSEETTPLLPSFDNRSEELRQRKNLNMAYQRRFHDQGASKISSKQQTLATPTALPKARDQGLSNKNDTGSNQKPAMEMEAALSLKHQRSEQLLPSSHEVVEPKTATVSIISPVVPSKLQQHNQKSLNTERGFNMKRKIAGPHKFQMEAHGEVLQKLKQHQRSLHNLKKIQKVLPPQKLLKEQAQNQPELSSRKITAATLNYGGADPNLAEGFTERIVTVERFNVVTKFAYATCAGKTSMQTVKINQDSFILAPSMLGQLGLHLFSVCDGHGINGHHVSAYVRDALPEKLKQQFLQEWGAVAKGNQLRQLYSKIPSILNSSFKDLHKDLYSMKYDTEFSGTTCVSLLIDRNTVFCANVGDSRAVLYSATLSPPTAGPRYSKKDSRPFVAKQLSIDHKPTLTIEQQRIQSNGGRVEAIRSTTGRGVGPARVWLKDEETPGLAMSRSLGDFCAHSVGVSCFPEIVRSELDEKSKFMVLASDGVWEFLSNEEVGDIVYPYYLKSAPEQAGNAIVQAASQKWKDNESSIDDITCVVLFLQVEYATPPQEEAVLDTPIANPSEVTPSKPPPGKPQMKSSRGGDRK